MTTTQRPRYFTSYRTVEELKANYRVLVKRYHPDAQQGGTSEDMAAINEEYAALFAQAVNGSRHAAEEGGHVYNEDSHAVDDDFRSTIDKIITLPGIEIEICGSWVWITGDTKPVHESLKAAGFKWAGKKQAWYWHSGTYSRRSRRFFSMDDIRSMHGSEKVAGKQGHAVGAGS